jgi:hypothetical protein
MLLLPRARKRARLDLYALRTLKAATESLRKQLTIGRSKRGGGSKRTVSSCVFTALGAIGARASKADPNVAGSPVVALRSPTLFLASVWHLPALPQIFPAGGRRLSSIWQFLEQPNIVLIGHWPSWGGQSAAQVRVVSPPGLCAGQRVGVVQRRRWGNLYSAFRTPPGELGDTM